MDKEKIGPGVQMIVLLVFIGMALACASQNEALVEDNKGTGTGLNEGASIELPTDSVKVAYDYALK